MTIGLRIKQTRAALGMSRPELARAANIPYPTLAGIENTDQGSSTRLHAIAKALGVSVEWLETGKGDPCHKSPSHSHHMTLDPEIVSDTHEALAKMYARGRRTYPRQDVERFVHLYEMFALRNAGVPEAELFGAGLSDFKGSGVVSERDKGVPDDGGYKGAVARRIRRKA